MPNDETAMRTFAMTGYLLLGFAMLGCAAPQADYPDHVPDGYRLVYQQDFDEPESINDFVFTDPDAWQYTPRDKARPATDAGGFLKLHKMSEYKPKHRSPHSIALLKIGAVGSFVLDVDMMQLDKEHAHRDLCLFFGFQGPSNYYYSHIAAVGDQNAHQVFIVDDKPRTPITESRTEGVKWGDKQWRKLRVVRDIEKGTITIYFEDMENPIQVAEDKSFGAGYIGFGSFDNVGRIDNIRLWAASISDEPCKHFLAKD